MKLLIVKILFLLLPVLFVKVPVLAIDITELGDFSSRSIIMSGKKSELSQEQKDILISKKLSPTTKCLIEQIKKSKNEKRKTVLTSLVNYQFGRNRTCVNDVYCQDDTDGSDGSIRRFICVPVVPFVLFSGQLFQHARYA